MTTNSLGLNKRPQETKVCVAMSGGVDSSAAAYLLKKQGYDVFGMTMDLLQPPYAPQVSPTADAAKVAEHLEIEHFYLDLRADFRRDVVDYFSNSYLRGETPSPCIMCNQRIKLGKLAEAAKAKGAEVIVTGHYADIRSTPQGAELHKGRDEKRDQSYFLFAVQKQWLQMLRCPLAGFSKEQTRALAAEAGLEIANKADSQDICFVSEGKYSELIAKLRGDYQDIPGDIVNKDGKVLGRHHGIIHYTIGQRRGLGIGGGDILYVKAIDAANNRIIAGGESDLYQKEVLLSKINWLGEERPDSIELRVKLRSRQKEVPARVEFCGETARVILKEDFAAAAPGQGCCFYDGTRVLGGGIIQNRL